MTMMVRGVAISRPPPRGHAVNHDHRGRECGAAIARAGQARQSVCRTFRDEPGASRARSRRGRSTRRQPVQEGGCRPPPSYAAKRVPMGRPGRRTAKLPNISTPPYEGQLSSPLCNSGDSAP